MLRRVAREVEARISQVRGIRIMLDEDLAELYGVQTRALNQAVKRNIERFPPDFMFRLTPSEARTLKSQTVISDKGRGGRRHQPLALTEQGVAMLSGVLSSHRAIQANVAIMRAFVRLRAMVISHVELKRKINALESKYDHQFKVVFDALRGLMGPPGRPRRKTGFQN